MKRIRVKETVTVKDLALIINSLELVTENEKIIEMLGLSENFILEEVNERNL